MRMQKLLHYEYYYILLLPNFKLKRQVPITPSLLSDIRDYYVVIHHHLVSIRASNVGGAVQHSLHDQVLRARLSLSKLLSCGYHYKSILPVYKSHLLQQFDGLHGKTLPSQIHSSSTITLYWRPRSLAIFTTWSILHVTCLVPIPQSGND